MKKILLATAMMLSLMACVKEVLPESAVTRDVEGEVTLNLSMIVPEAQVATKGTFSAPTITSLNVLVFDDKGYLVGKVPAKHEDGSAWTETIVTKSEVPFEVTLPKSGAPCHLHFVANADVSGVGFGLETDIMTNLTTSGTADAYWQVVKLPRLIDAGDLTSPIKLIRNFAKVTLVSSVKTFKPTGYALITYPISGTVVPYNTSNADFQDCVDKDHADLTSAKYVAFQPAKVAYSTHNFEAAEWKNADGAAWTTLAAESATDDNSLKITGNPLYTYESTYGKVFLLVRGIFDQAGDGFDNDAVSYYKVDFYDELLGNCDILRNIEYQFTIDNVVGHGYSSPGDAADPEVPAGNNISNSIKTQPLLNISDGKQKLSVEYTSKWVVSNQPFTLKYMFQPDNAYAVTNNKLSSNNGPITISSKITDESGRTNKIDFQVKDPSVTNGYSTIEITPAGLPEGDEIWKEEITITSVHNNVKLTRIVKLYFKQSYEMQVNCVPIVVEGAVAKEVLVNTTIPGNLSEDIFPLVFEIEAEEMSLYPDLTKKSDGTLKYPNNVMPVVSGPSIISGKTKNSFHYERTLTWAEYESLGGGPESTTNVTVPSYFLTNKADNASNVYVRNDYFKTAYGYFVNNSSLIDEGYYGAGNKVELVYTSTGSKTFKATAAKFENGNSEYQYNITQSPFTAPLTTTDWNTQVVVNDGTTDIKGVATRNKLAMKATKILVDHVEYTGSVVLGIYTSEDNAKALTGSIGSAVTTDLKTSDGSLLVREGLAVDTRLWFAYEVEGYVWYASATAKQLYDGAVLTFTGFEKPLEMSATLEGEQYYGVGKTVTLNLTTNKAGIYTVTFTEEGASPLSTTARITVNAGSTSGSAAYTTRTFGGAISASVKYEGNAADGTNPVTVDGRTRNVLVLGKMTASGQNTPQNNTTVTIYSASGTNLGTPTWLQLKTGGVEVTVDNLTPDQDEALYFQYSVRFFGTTTYTSQIISVSDAINGKQLSFED